MAKPTPRTPSKPATAAAAAPLTPAPDNGVPYTGSGPAATKGKARAGRQLGQRIPADLYDRLVAASTDTEVPMSRLLVRAIEAEVTRLGH